MRQKIIIYSLLVSLISLIINLTWLKNPILGLCFFTLFFSTNILIIGAWLKQKHAGLLNYYWLAGLILICFISLSGAITYYFYELNNWICIIIAIIIALFSIILALLNNLKTDFKIAPPKFKFTTLFLLGLYCFLLIISVNTVFGNQTQQAIFSPWNILSSNIFYYYFAATLILIILILKKLNNFFVQILLAIHLFLSVSILLILLPLGYGFDSFIHQATEKVIYEKGLILPKPFFYLGQYSLVVWLAKITQVSVIFWDKIIISLISACFLPTAIYTFLKSLTDKNPEHNTKIQLTTLAFLIIPFPYLIVTTPQSLAYIFSLILIFLSFLREESLPLVCLILLALTALFIHPLAGLPTIIFLLFLKTTKLINHRKVILVSLTIFALILIPAVFIINSKINHSLINLTWPKSLILENHSFIALQFLFRDFIYFYKNYLFLVIIAGAIYGYRLLLKKNNPLAWILPLTSVILFSNYLIIKHFFIFSDLIEYERQDYSSRLLNLSQFFLMPLFLFAIYKLIDKTFRKPFWLMTAFNICLFAGLITASFYLSYPRYDFYEANKGLNVSQADFLAAREIEIRSQQKSYVVLSPQTTSAAALSIFGFDRQENGYYFYPIPTGGKLYGFYLDLVYDEPTIATINEAKKITGVEKVYFVIPQFWKNSFSIIDKTKKIATDYFEINDGEITIFSF